MKNVFKFCAGIIAVTSAFSLAGCEGKSAYDLACENGYTGTVEEWLESLKGKDASSPTISINEEGYWVINGVVSNVKATGSNGENGTNGKEVELRYYEGSLQWKYVGTSEWTNLVSISNGTNGKDGKSVELSEDNGKILWRYTGESNWTELITITNGVDGKTWFCRETAPVNTEGKDGDLFLDSSSYCIYQKISGTWVEIGCIRNSTWLTGTTNPEDSLGRNGDMYLNSFSCDVFQKTNNAWVYVCNIKGTSGDQGNNGASFLHGEGIPANTFGSNGDIYLDLDTNDIYSKSSNEWNKVGNIEGKKGNGVSKVDIEYIFNDKGELCFKFTFTLEDLSEKFVTVALPKEVVALSLVQTEYVIGSTQNTLQLKVQYEDEEPNVIDVTEDMIIDGEVNFDIAGSYDLKIRYQNKIIDTTVEVYDKYDRTITGIESNQENVILLLDNDTIIEDYTGLTFNVLHKNKETYTLPLSEASVEIDDTNIQNGTPTTATIKYMRHSTTINILPVDNLESYEVISGKYIGETEKTIKVNEDPFTKGEYISYIVDVSNIEFIYNQVVTLSMLDNVSIQYAGECANCTFKQSSVYADISSKISFVIFDSSLVFTNCTEYTTVTKAVDTGIPEIYVTLYGFDDNNFIDVYYTTLLTEEMIDASLYDFSKSGTVNIEITDIQSIEVTLYTEEENISSIELVNVPNISIPVNTTTDSAKDILLEALKYSAVKVNYYEKISGFNYDFVKIIEDMLDLTNLDLSTQSTQEIKISYLGYEVVLEIEIENA